MAPVRGGDTYAAPGPPLPPAGTPPAAPQKPIPITAPLPGIPTNPAFVNLGIPLTIDQINDTIQHVDAGHQQAFGHAPSPGLAFDVIRGVASGSVPDPSKLFDIPTSSRQAKVMGIAPPKPSAAFGDVGDPTAAQHGFPPEQGHTLSALDPNAGADLARAQGHPLTPQQQEAFRLAQGKDTMIQARKNMVEAGILPKLQIVNDKPFSYILRGAAMTAKGIFVGLPVLGYKEATGVARIVQDIQTGNAGKEVKDIKGFGSMNSKIGRGVAVGTYNDFHALLTGDMAYFRAHPDAPWNIGLTLWGGAGLLESAAKRAAAFSEAEGAGAKFMAALRKPSAGTKALTLPGDKGAASVDRLQFEQPLTRWADNIFTEGRARRAFQMKEPVAAEALRAVKLDSVADWVSNTFSYQAKFRRESQATIRTQSQMSLYLAHQLDQIAGSTMDASMALDAIPEIEKGKLTSGELQALRVLNQGGDWREALQTMRQQHENWQAASAAAGDLNSVAAHTTQLSTLKLAQKVLEDHENGAASKTFQKAVPLFAQASDFLTQLKIDHLGLDPEHATERAAMEYEIYKSGKPLADRKKLANLLRNQQKRYDYLAARKGPVAPELRVRLDEIKEQLPSAEPEAQKALLAERDALNARVKAQQEVEHPDLRAAGIKVEALQRVLDRTQERIANAERRSGARRTPTKSRLTRIGSGAEFMGRRPEYGDVLPKAPPELTHSFTGKSITWGDLNLNIVNLLSNEIKGAVRTVARLDDYRMKLDSSYTERPQGDIAHFFAPMRDVSEIPEKWRRLVSKGRRGEPALSEEEVAALTEAEVENFHEQVYGFKRDPETNEWIIDNPKGVRWYDSRAFEEHVAQAHDAWGWYLTNAYNTIGRARIFLAPRYILYTLNNKSMLLLDEGPFMPVSMTASYFAKKIYDEETVGRIDAHMGSSRSRSLGPATDEGPLSAPSRATLLAANFLHLITDMNDRRASFLYHAWRMGYVSKDDMRALVTDESNLKDLNEIRRRGEKAVVELGNLTWTERQYMRHLLFVYTWRSRQFLWTFRTIAEHPAFAEILARIGENALNDWEQNKPTYIKHAIDYYTNQGYIVTGWNPDGSPKLMDAGRLSSFGGLADLLHPDITSSLGPGVQLGIEIGTGRDSRGRAFKGSAGSKILSALTDVAIGTLPQKQAYDRAHKVDPTIPPLNWASLKGQMNQISAAQKEAALDPGWLNGFGILFTGSLTERPTNKYRLLYTYYHSLNNKEKAAFERKSIMAVLGIQGQMLGKAIPAKVRTAVDVTAEVSYRANEQALKQGSSGGVTEGQRDQILTQVLLDKKLINQTTYDLLEKDIKLREPLPSDHSQWRNFVMTKYAGGKVLHLWADQVRLLHTYSTPAGFNQKLDRLNAMGLHSGAVTAAPPTLLEVGRQVVAYEDKVRSFQTALKHEVDPVRKEELKLQQALYFANHGDQPLVVAGKTFPSASRLSISDLTTHDLHTHLLGAAGRSWTTLSPLDKRLLGHPSDPQVAVDWATINLQMAKEHALLKPGETLSSRGLPPKSYYVKGLAKESPAFAADVKFASQPLAIRLSQYKPIKNSTYSDYWKAFLGTIAERAKQYAKAYVTSTGTVNWSAAKKDWANAVPYMENWVRQQPQGFRDEVASFVAHDPSFYYKLVRP